MKRSTIPLGKNFGSKALSSLRMILSSASHTRMLLSFAMLVMMMFAPSFMKGATTTMDFGDAGRAHYFQYANSSTGYYATVNMSSTDYSGISGAKIGDNITYKYGNTKGIDISRLAFVFNSSAHGNENNTNAGLYLRRDGSNSGLYAGAPNNTEFAILDMKPGNNVTIYFTGGSGVYNVTQGQWFTSGQAMNVNNLGDLRIGVTQGTYISSITIDEQIAEYDTRINADGSSEFWFTAPGTLEDNDFALPFLSVSMGSINDYLVVQGTSDQNYSAHMIKTTGQGAGTETLETNGTDSQPSAGSFYAFKPTANGTIEVSGDLTSGGRVHLFVYDGGWVERESEYVFYRETFTSNYFSFSVENGKTYYLCINNLDQSEHGYAFHLHWFKFTNTFKVGALAKVIDLTNVSDGSWIELTSVTGYNSYNIHTKRCSGNITPPASEDYMIQNNFLYMKKPTFAEGSDNAGTVVIDVKTNGGDFVFVATFPYHADYNPAGYTDTDRTYGHTWNFIDPRLSDSNIGNCWINNGWDSFDKGTVSGILSIGQYKDVNSQFRRETDNREWTYGWSIKDSSGNITDPMYKNVFDMEGDNADMIWETEGLWFDTGTNLSCLYNENDVPRYWKVEDGQEIDVDPSQPTMFYYTAFDPDRYVGLLADADGASSFTIPGLKDGDRVLIFMKSGEKSGGDRETIFLNIEGALDAVGNPISSDYLYGAGGAIWAEHSRYEGCYHFIKDATSTPMKFTMKRGAICKLMYIRIYSGKRIDTNRVLRGGTSSLLFLNDEGTAQEDAAGGWYQMHYRGKGEQIDAKVLVHSGNLTDDSFSSSGDNKKLEVNVNKTAVSFKSTVGEFGVFRLRLMDMDFAHGQISGQGMHYVCDFADRNFTVGYREKMSYPYTWDFTDMQTYSGTDIAAENTLYPETTNPYERLGWDISLWGDDGYMVIGNSEDYQDDGDIFSQNKDGFGNQLYANKTIIPETQGLWFYMDNNYPIYNGCMQITSEGLHFINTNLTDNSHDPWWNYKVVVPSVPDNGAVYLRIKRDSRVNETDYKTGNNGDVLFLNTRFSWGTGSKTSLSERNTPYKTQENGAAYSFFKVAEETITNEGGTSVTIPTYVVAVKNTTGAINHLTFTLNGWIVEKLSVSTDYKNIGTTGYATESRTRVIDHSLTEQFTGLPIKAYQAKLNSDKNKAILTEVHFLNKAVNEGDLTGCVLHNETTSETKEVKVLANGFNLFVPDMHDTALDDISNNVMMAHLNGNNVESSSSTTSYVLSAKPYDKSQVGLDEKTYLGDGKTVAFYRVDPQSGARLAANSAYLQQSVNQARILMFFSDVFGETPTAIETVEPAAEENAVWHNLNGQAINAPMSAGVYIRNGKKVIVK